MVKDGKPFEWRRDATWIMPNGNALLTIPVMAEGTYDTDRVSVLPRSDPWHKVARKLLRHGGQAVEFPPADSDRSLASLLLSSAALTPAKGAMLRPGTGGEGHCITNAQEVASCLPGARLAVGLALLYDLWVIHVWVLPLFGRIMETSSPVVAKYYCGLPATSELMRRWETALGAAEAL